LLLPVMLRGLIYRMALSPDGRSVVGPPMPYFKTTNRYRDLAVAPDQRTFYVITDNDGRTTDEKGAPVRTVANPGAILEFKYVGAASCFGVAEATPGDSRRPRTYLPAGCW